MSQELAREFGWQPAGPWLCPLAPRDAPRVRETSYEPDGWIRGIHEVETDDARAWGSALDACVAAVEAGEFELPKVRSSTLIRDGMTLNEFRQANRGFTLQFLRAFAEFLSKGAFEFGWDG